MFTYFKYLQVGIVERYYQPVMCSIHNHSYIAFDGTTSS